MVINSIVCFYSNNFLQLNAKYLKNMFRSTINGCVRATTIKSEMVTFDTVIITWKKWIWFWNWIRKWFKLPWMPPILLTDNNHCFSYKTISTRISIWNKWYYCDVSFIFIHKHKQTISNSNNVLDSTLKPTYHTPYTTCTQKAFQQINHCF